MYIYLKLLQKKIVQKIEYLINEMVKINKRNDNIEIKRRVKERKIHFSSTHEFNKKNIGRLYPLIYFSFLLKSKNSFLINIFFLNLLMS